MKDNLKKKILDKCKIYSEKPYLGSDGFHHKYGNECISLKKLDDILTLLEEEK